MKKIAAISTLLILSVQTTTVRADVSPSNAGPASVSDILKLVTDDPGSRPWLGKQAYCSSDKPVPDDEISENFMVGGAMTAGGGLMFVGLLPFAMIGAAAAVVPLAIMSNRFDTRVQEQVAGTCGTVPNGVAADEQKAWQIVCGTFVKALLKDLRTAGDDWKSEFSGRGLTLQDKILKFTYKGQDAIRLAGLRTAQTDLRRSFAACFGEGEFGAAVSSSPESFTLDQAIRLGLQNIKQHGGRGMLSAVPTTNRIPPSAAEMSAAARSYLQQMQDGRLNMFADSREAINAEALPAIQVLIKSARCYKDSIWWVEKVLPSNPLYGHGGENYNSLATWAHQILEGTAHACVNGDGIN